MSATVGSKVLERPKAWAVSAASTDSQTTDQAKESNPGGYKVNNWNASHGLGQGNLGQRIKDFEGYCKADSLLMKNRMKLFKNR